MLKLAMEMVIGGLIAFAVVNNVVAPLLEDAAQNTANCISGVSVCDTNNGAVKTLSDLSNGIIG